MSDPTPTLSPPPASDTASVPKRGIRLALIGILISFLALGLAVYRTSLESTPPPPPTARDVSDVLSDTFKKTVDKIRRKPANPPPAANTPAWSTSQKLALAASACGFLGAAFGCASLLFREQRRWTWTAIGIGLLALAWNHVIVAIGLGVGIAILLWILGNLT
jgi:hypothetical protein